MTSINVAVGDRSEEDAMTVEVDYYDLDMAQGPGDIFLTVGPQDDEDAQQVAVLTPEAAIKIGQALMDAAMEKQISDFARDLA